MKRELTLTDIAGYLPYGLKLLDRKRGMTTVWEWQSAACCDWNGEEKVEMISGEKYSEELVMASPILRPMSDLFVKITERDYNDGKPFIPISELANIVEEQESARWVFEQEDKRMYSCSNGKTGFYRTTTGKHLYELLPSAARRYALYQILTNCMIYSTACTSTTAA